MTRTPPTTTWTSRDVTDITWASAGFSWRETTLTWADTLNKTIWETRTSPSTTWS